MTLAEYLEQNPWPEKWISTGRPVEYFFTYRINASIADIWPYISDTSSINRAIGLSRMKFAEKNGRLYGESRMAGILHQWEELPWQWEYGRELRAERVYSRGIVRYVRVHNALEELPGGECRITFYLGWIPRNTVGRFLLISARKTMERKVGIIFSDMAGKTKKPVEFNILPSGPLNAPPMLKKSESDASRIAAIHRRLLADGLDHETVDRFILHVTSADDGELYRLRPRRLSRALGADFSTLLGIMLHATRGGLLILSWDAMCPHCRGVRGRVNHLWEVPARSNCDVCNIEFDTTGINGIEVTFRINPEIKKVDEIFYCSAEPAKKAHILMQKTLLPGEINTSTPDFPEGAYRLRIQGRKIYNTLELKSGEKPRGITWDDRADGENFETAPGFSLRMKNASINRHTFIVEKIDEDQDALRPRDLFNFQDFRDLFTEEFLELGLSMDVGVQNIMFIDIVKSSVLYNREGNSRAFSIVREFFKRGTI